MQRRSSRLSPSVVAGVAATTLLAGAALAATGNRAQPKNTPSFEPVPQQVTIQRFEVAPDFGDTKVVMTLDRSEVLRLQAETGRTDLLLVGPIHGRTVLRDDGQFPDDIAGDRGYTGFAFTSDEEILRRAAHNVNIVPGVTEHLVFDGRAIVGSEPAEPFDVDGFFQGEPVNLEPLEPLPDEPFPDEPFPDDPIPLPDDGTAVLGTNTFQVRSLFITDPGVIDDPYRTVDPCNPGTSTSLPPWSFGRLMYDMANPAVTGLNASSFVENWMRTWLSNQTINSFNVPARVAMQGFIDEWRTASGGGALNLRKAPFELIAIVNRTDLRDTTTSGGGYGGSTGTNFLNAGEGRFIFTLVDRRGGGCELTPFNVILEYGVPIRSCTAVRQWAVDWSALASLTPGSSTYNSKLQALTDVFAKANANPNKPNRSAINQVRTNENQLDPLWQLREFRLLNPTVSQLIPTTMADTPDDSFDGSAGFNGTNAINTFLTSAAAGGPVPAIHPTLGVPFLGGSSQTPFDPRIDSFWDGSPSLGTSNTRHLFSLGTCNGCHGAETDTFFVHVNPGFIPFPPGFISAPPLSGFLTGINGVVDPTQDLPTPPGPPLNARKRSFDDLQRRENDLATVRGLVCSIISPVPEPCLTECGPVPLDPEVHFAAQAPVSISFDEFLTPPVTQVH